MKQLRAKSVGQLLKIIRDKRQPVNARSDAIAVIGLRRMKSVMGYLFEIQKTSPELRKIFGVTLSALISEEADKFHETQKAILESVIRDTQARTEKGLIRCLKDPSVSGELRSRICQVLGDLRSLTAIPTLLQTLDSRPSKVSWAAEHALVTIQSRCATPGLLSIIRRPKWSRGRSSATYVLKSLDDERADKVLLRILRDRRYGDYIRTDAAEGLTWKYRPDEVLKVLLNTAQDKSAYMRYTAINCLDYFWESYPGIGESQTKRTLATLRKCCSDKGGIRGYEENNGGRARQVLRNYRQFTSL
jgi:hypothetical protein